MLELMKKLVGRGLFVEFGHPLKSAPEIMVGYLWKIEGEGEDTILVFVTQRDDKFNVQITKEEYDRMVNPIQPGQALPSNANANQTVKQTQTVNTQHHNRAYCFRFVPLKTIISVEIETGIQLYVERRRITLRGDPLFSDRFSDWYLIDSALKERLNVWYKNQFEGAAPTLDSIQGDPEKRVEKLKKFKEWLTPNLLERGEKPPEEITVVQSSPRTARDPGSPASAPQTPAQAETIPVTGIVNPAPPPAEPEEGQAF